MARSRLIALGVPEGDSFYLETPEIAILVDGGKELVGQETLPKRFRRVTNRRRVDVLVCTHNDDDHADGVLRFLQAGLCCGEVWLPALWRDFLAHLRSQRGFIQSLIDGVESRRLLLSELCEPAGSETALERLGEHLVDTIKVDLAAREGQSSFRSLSETAISEEQVIHPDSSPKWISSFHGFNAFIPTPNLSPQQLTVLREAVIAGVRICKIYSAARRRGTKVRWFAHDPSKGNEGCQFVHALNATEIRLAPPRNLSELR